MKCKYFKKETGDKYCSNYLGPQIVGAYGEGTITVKINASMLIVRNLKNYKD